MACAYLIVRYVNYFCRSSWDKILESVECKILDVIEHEDQVAYLLRFYFCTITSYDVNYNSVITIQQFKFSAILLQTLNI